MNTFRFAREPDEVLPPGAPLRRMRRAGGAEDDDRVKAGQFLLSALADARDELSRRLGLVNAGIDSLAIISPVFGAVVLTADLVRGDGSAFQDAERVVQAVDQVLATTGPRLLERIANGEASRLESLRVLVANVTTTIEQTIVDVTFANSDAMRFLREVIARSFEDLGNFVRNLPEQLPKVGIGVGAFLLGLAALLFAWDSRGR